MDSRTKQVTFRITEEMYKQIKEIAVKEDRSFAQIVRQSCEDKVKRSFGLASRQ